MGCGGAAGVWGAGPRGVECSERPAETMGRWKWSQTTVEQTESLSVLTQ